MTMQMERRREHTVSHQPLPQSTYSPEEEQRQRIDAEREDALRRAREAAEREEQRRREHEALINAHYSYISDQWTTFQRLKHGAPPKLLPLEARRELETFQP